MSAPIPISSSSPSSPPDPKAIVSGHHPSASTSSTISSSPSPQTPFSPSFSLSAGAASNPNSSILKWASSSFSLGKSPTASTVPMPIIDSGHHGHGHDHDHEGHDALEFGDISDLNKSSWTGHNRRAVSMSNASGIPAATSGGSTGLGMSPTKASGGQGGISAMLSGFGASGGTVAGQGSVPLGSPPLVGGGGVFAENVAKGQGVLRRLSLGGAGRGRPQFPSQQSQPTIAASIPDPQTAPLPPAPVSPVDSNKLQPEGGGVGFAQRGRRYSENPGAAGKKRGVSPMGERLLRDHGHF